MRIMRFLLAGVVASALAVETHARPLFGPRVYTRTSGAPQTIHETFDLRGSATAYRLTIDNAGGTSATVTLNGIDVATPDDFHHNIPSIIRAVPLHSSNELSVRLAGAPGSSMTISITAAAGPAGATITSAGRALLSIPPGALSSEVSVGLDEVDPATIPLPGDYAMLGAVAVDLGGAELAIEADLAIPATAQRAIVARVLDFGSEQRLAMIDTASNGADGLLHTDSPPFPGLLSEGTFVFASMPAGVGIIGVDVRSQTTGAAVPNALVQLATMSGATSAMSAQTSFLGVTDRAGFAGVPAATGGSTIAILTSAAGTSPAAPLLGAETLTLPDVIPVVPNLADRITTFIHSLAAGALPQPVDPCDCPTLDVLPRRVPLGPDTFETGESIQLNVFCGADDVTQSTDIDDALDLLVNGFDVHWTIFRPSNAAISVSGDGLLRAESPGNAAVGVVMGKLTLMDFNGKPHIRACVSSGAVAPVIVNATLQLTTTGSGSGSIASSPPGSSHAPGTIVMLTAAAAPDSTFVQWEGDCAGNASVPTIVITLDANTSCAARFELLPRLTVSTIGPGRVQSLPLIDCGTDCDAYYPSGAAVTLTAIPDAGATLIGWSGHCSGSNPTASVTMDSDRSCTAEFSPGVTITVEIVSRGGTGRVVSNPSGIDCSGGTCSAAFPVGTRVTLSSIPNSGSSGGEWDITVPTPPGMCGLSTGTGIPTASVTAFTPCTARVAFRPAAGTATILGTTCSRLTSTSARFTVTGTVDGPAYARWDVGQYAGIPSNAFFFHVASIDPFGPSPVTFSVSNVIHVGSPPSQPIPFGGIVRMFTPPWVRPIQFLANTVGSTIPCF